MTNLDDEAIYGRLDPDGMGDAIESFYKQTGEAWRIGSGAGVPADYANIGNLVIQGMGGSAIGGDLIRALYENQLPVPCAVVRDYELPRYAGSDTLYIASSYSGNTEETLAGYAQAKERGCRILAVTTGGRLADMARADGYPLIIIPGGLQPRAALGYSFFPLVAVLGKLGLVPDAAADVKETISMLEAGSRKFCRTAPVADNPPKGLAQWLYGQYPLIYAAGTWPGVVAMRWKGQFNENAKNLAFWNAFPELNHNETVGFEAPSELVGRIRLVVLHSGHESVRIAKRIEVTAGIISRAGAQVREVGAEGRSALCRMFSLIQYGDFTTYYLAILNGSDPSPVKVIEYLKGELAKL